MYHALALIAATRVCTKWPGVGEAKCLGPVTPIGGLALLAGWVLPGGGGAGKGLAPTA